MFGATGLLLLVKRAGGRGRGGGGRVGSGMKNWFVTEQLPPQLRRADLLQKLLRVLQALAGCSQRAAEACQSLKMLFRLPCARERRLSVDCQCSCLRKGSLMYGFYKRVEAPCAKRPWAQCFLASVATLIVPPSMFLKQQIRQTIRGPFIETDATRHGHNPNAVAFNKTP